MKDSRSRYHVQHYEHDNAADLQALQRMVHKYSSDTHYHRHYKCSSIEVSKDAPVHGTLLAVDLQAYLRQDQVVGWMQWSLQTKGSQVSASIDGLGTKSYGDRSRYGGIGSALMEYFFSDYLKRCHGEVCYVWTEAAAPGFYAKHGFLKVGPASAALMVKPILCLPPLQETQERQQFLYATSKPNCRDNNLNSNYLRSNYEQMAKEVQRLWHVRLGPQQMLFYTIKAK